MNRHTWTDSEIEYLKAHYPCVSSGRIASHLGLKIGQVYCKANSLGLKKSDAFLNGDESGRLKGQLGSSTRFKPGQDPWNKGKKGYTAGGRSAETQFKPGEKPHTWNPIGHERITRDGYLERKLTDTGVTRNDYVAVHRLIWEEANGRIPKGHVVVFKDKNPRNLTIENLEMISRADLARRNTIHRYPKEIADAIRQVSGLKRRIRNIEKKRGKTA